MGESGHYLRIKFKYSRKEIKIGTFLLEEKVIFDPFFKKVR